MGVQKEEAETTKEGPQGRGGGGEVYFEESRTHVAKYPLEVSD